jgi:filamentous hemagglutinin
MVDRKLSITTFPKSQMQALRQSAVAAENGYSVRWEVPNQSEATRALNMFEQLGIKNIQVVIVPNQ